MKNVIKILGFGAGVVIILSVLSVVFNGGYLASKRSVMYYDRRIAEFSKEPEGEIEVLCVGDSLCGAGFCSPTLYRDYGITGFNMGKEMQKSVESYYCVKKAITRQPIKVVLWETHNMTKKYKGLDPFSYGLAESLRYRFPVIKYHTFWKFLTDGRYLRKYFKGFLVDEKIKPYEGPVPYYDPSKTETFELQYDQEYMLRKVKKLCDDNGIKLVLVSFISPKCYKFKEHVCFDKAAREIGVDYLDLNTCADEVGIDWARDFTDKGDHVNEAGAEKMTAYLGKYLSEECGLSDHRGEAAYQAWDDMLVAYAQEIVDMDGIDYFKIEDEAGVQRQVLWLRPIDHDTYEDKK